MNKLLTATEKVGADIEAIVEKLDEVANGFDYKRHRYRRESYERQGATSLARKLTEAANLLDSGLLGPASEVLDDVAARWNDREDWRAAAFASNTARRVERLVGLN